MGCWLILQQKCRKIWEESQEEEPLNEEINGERGKIKNVMDCKRKNKVDNIEKDEQERKEMFLRITTHLLSLQHER